MYFVARSFILPDFLQRFPHLLLCNQTLQSPIGEESQPNSELRPDSDEELLKVITKLPSYASVSVPTSGVVTLAKYQSEALQSFSARNSVTIFVCADILFNLVLTTQACYLLSYEASSAFSITIFQFYRTFYSRQVNKSSKERLTNQETPLAIGVGFWSGEGELFLEIAKNWGKVECGTFFCVHFLFGVVRMSEKILLPLREDTCWKRQVLLYSSDFFITNIIFSCFSLTFFPSRQFLPSWTPRDGLNFPFFFFTSSPHFHSSLSFFRFGNNAEEHTRITSSEAVFIWNILDRCRPPPLKKKTSFRRRLPEDGPYAHRPLSFRLHLRLISALQHLTNWVWH